MSKCLINYFYLGIYSHSNRNKQSTESQQVNLLLHGFETGEYQAFKD